MTKNFFMPLLYSGVKTLQKTAIRDEQVTLNATVPADQIL